MNGSICPSAQCCGAFNPASCRDDVDCEGPIKPNQQAAEKLRKILPSFEIDGTCCNCGNAEKLTHINANNGMCRTCFTFLVLPRRNANKKQVNA